jgi:hypothetical protein
MADIEFVSGGIIEDIEQPWWGEITHSPSVVCDLGNHRPPTYSLNLYPNTAY